MKSNPHCVEKTTGLSNIQAEKLGRSVFLAWVMNQETGNWQAAAKQEMAQQAPPDFDARVWAVYQECLKQANHFEFGCYAPGSRRRACH